MQGVVYAMGKPCCGTALHHLHCNYSPSWYSMLVIFSNVKCHTYVHTVTRTYVIQEQAHYIFGPPQMNVRTYVRM